MTDFLDILFGGGDPDPAAHAAMRARLDAELVAEKARVSALKAERVAAAAASRCTRCGGTGMLTQFMHRNNGVCYGCGGSGRLS